MNQRFISIGIFAFLALVLFSAVPCFAADTIPNITISAPANDNTTFDTTPEIVFEVTASRNATGNFVEVVVNGTVDAQVNISNKTATRVNLSILSRGLYKLDLRVYNETNAAGGTGSVYNDTVNFTLAHYLNQTDITSPVTGYNTSDTTPEIAFRVEGRATAYDIKVFVDSVHDGNQSCANKTTCRYNLTTQADGAQSVIVQAIKNGTTPRNSTAITINVDATAPTATYSSDSVGSNSQIEADKTHDFQVTVTDATTSVDTCLFYYNDVSSAVTVTGGSCNTTHKVIANGNYYFVVNDSAGNSVTSTRRYFRAEDTGGAIGIAQQPTGIEKITQAVKPQPGAGGVFAPVTNFFGGIADAIGSFFGGIADFFAGLFGK